MMRCSPTGNLLATAGKRRGDIRCRAARAATLFRLIVWACAFLMVLAPARSARGDGGIVRVSRRSGPYLVTVFTTPTPLRVGKADVSVMVQTGETNQVVTDTEATVRLSRPGRDATRGPYPMTRGQATNRLLKAAVVAFPSPGPWTIEVDVEGAVGSSHVQFTADVGTAPPRWVDLLPWIAWPLVAIAAFAFREAVVHSRRRRRTDRLRSSAKSGRRGV